MTKSTQNPNSNKAIFKGHVETLVAKDTTLANTTNAHGKLWFTTILSGAILALEMFPNSIVAKEEKVSFGKEFLSKLQPQTRKKCSADIFILIDKHSGMIKANSTVEDLRKAVAEQFATTTTKTVDGEQVETSEPCDSVRKLAKALRPKTDKTKSEDVQIANNPDIAKLKTLFLNISKLSGDNVDEICVIVSKMKPTTDNPIVPLVSVEAFNDSLNKPFMAVVRDIRKTDNETSLEVA